MQRLADEFHLANAAGAPLDVAAERAFAPHLGVDQAFHFAHCFNGAKVQIAAVNEGAGDLGEQRPVGLAAVDHAALD